MQIGSRWGAGTAPHPSVPESVRPAVLRVDEDGHTGSWTLTWLEGRPVCTRDDDTVVSINAQGEVSVAYPGTQLDDNDDDDDWLLE